MYIAKMYISFFLGLLTAQTSQADNLYEASVRLESMLFERYNRETRPVFDDNDNVTIYIGVSLYLIQQMDDKYQILTTSLWIRQKWYDRRLTWKPSDFSSLKVINIRSGQVWLPDIKVYNEIDRRVDSGLDQFRTRVIIDYLGNVLWMAPSILRSSCQVDLELFPYDTQTCKFKVGSWTYDGSSVDVVPENYTLDISKSPTNPEWVLLSTSVQKNIQFYPCCPESYPDITYTIKIKRRVQSYWMNFIFPGIFLTMMTMLTFLTPASDTGERISLVLVSLVSMFFFLKMIADKTPPSDTIPLLSVYFVMLSFEIGLIFYSVCISVNAYHNRALVDMPIYFRAIVLDKLGWLWGLSGEGKAIITRVNELNNLCKAEDMFDEENVDLSSFDISFPKKERSVNCRNNSTVNPTSQTRSCVQIISGDIETLSTCTQAVASSIIYAGNEFIWMANARNKTTQNKGTRDKDTQNKDTRNKDTRNKDTRNKDTRNKDTRNKGTRNETRRYKTPGLQALDVTTGPSTSTNYETQEDLICSCPSLIEDMVIANARLLSSIREILAVAQKFDKKSCDKERWLVASSILDRTFLVLFVLIFIALSLLNSLQ